ncbi:MAG: amino acid permease [Chloroflexi bacterium]|nr:amino acid permease [Chloroflexota bacterium]MBU1746897.1 amino acid permease [Chloroflexota bacterium]MBU1879684.1 amino acid permease [Chloroflexota bacterium]
MATHNTNQGEVTLARTLGLFDATMIGLGAMIGAGVFVLTGIATGEAGPAAIIAFALNGIVTMFTAFSYAELASAIPEAGGGYSFVKRAMPTSLGFLAGWMLWFAYTVACALYATGFGGYFVELLSSYWPAAHAALVGTLGQHWTVALFTFVISAFFVTLNVLGADVTGKAENIVTVTKVIILGVFIAFGLVALFQRPDAASAFTPLFPKGFGGVLVAMGLTFIAFEGYDLIATISEEVKDPTKNIPLATFISLGIAVIIYLFILLVSIGAVDPHNFDVFGMTYDQLPAALGIHAPIDPNDPTINTAWEIMGIYKETGIVRAAENFMPEFGVALIVFGGLFSTMSALNASVLASSRVGFSMGRERMLPRILGVIHPTRRTPHVAVLVTGLIIIAIAIGLPLEVVGSGASLMFLLSFALTNAAMILIRVREPNLKRGYREPLFPLLPILGIVSNLGLAIYQFTFQPLAWYVGLAWVALGVVVYLVYTVRAEKGEPLPVKILLEERLVPKDYQVLIPLANEEQGRLLGILGAAIAWAHDGEVLALHVVRVPVQLSISDGRVFLKEGRPILETAIRQAKQVNVPVHTMIRLDRSIDRAIRETARERQVDLMILGWPGYTESEDRAFGSVIDDMAQDPPSDLAVVRFREREAPHSIMLPTAGGLNAALALELALAQAREYQHRTNEQPRIVVFTVMRPGTSPEDQKHLQQNVARITNGIDYPIETKMTFAPDIVEGILAEAEHHNLVIMGATEEGPFERLFFGTIPERVARQCPKTVIMVKRYRGPVRFWLQRLWGALTGRSQNNGGNNLSSN